MYKLISNRFNEHEREIIEAIRQGQILIYPTDTIYGLGCDATNEIAVKKIREIKGRDTKPFSVIAPNKAWIMENCKVDENELKRLPGPYTLFLTLRNENAISKAVNPTELSVGVRIPKHWFSQLVEKSGVPIVTTSVNKSGEKYMEKLEELDKVIKDQVNLIIYEGEKKGKPSEKIDLRTV